MKILKLSLIFLATLGIVFGALWLTMGGSNTTPTPPDPSLYRELSDTINNQWKNMDPWSREAYDRTRNDLDQKKVMGLIDSDQHDRLTELLRNCAINRLYDLTVKEFKGPKCRDALVTAYDKEAQRLNSEKADKERLQKLDSIYTLYANIRDFVKGDFSYKADFDGESWTSLDTHRDKALSKAANYRENAIYTEFLSNIEGFAKGLSDATVRDKIEMGRKAYYGTLTNQIKKYFNNGTRTTEEAKKLYRIYDRFRNECGEERRTLYDYYKAFKDSIEPSSYEPQQKNPYSF